MKKKWYSLGILLAAALVLYAAVRTGTRLWQNHQLVSAFQYTDYTGWQQYRDGVPMEEIEFGVYASLFEVNMTTIGRQTQFTLSEPLTYYEESGGEKRPALTLEAGSRLNSGIWEPGYGFFSYPTYEAGWRWVQPFVPDGEEPEMDAPRYYVKLEELAAAARPIVTKETLPEGLSVEEACHLWVCQADIFFYDNGVFLSPDRFSPVWSWDCTASILLAVLDLAGLLLLAKRSQHSTQPNNANA